MNVEELMENYDINHWKKYDPYISHYSKYLPNVIAASVKIVDVYYQISNARVSLMYMDLEDYGQLIAKDDFLHHQFIKSKFLFDSLAYYNYSIDLSWQVLYYYFGDNDYGILQDERRYEKIAKECNEQSLKLQLYFKKQNKISDFVFRFFNKKQTEDIRAAYNYLKHRGTFYVDGLGSNDKFFPLNLDGSRLRMITRQEVDLVKWKDKLIKFDISFFEYFNILINWVMPKDYTNGSCSFTEPILLMDRLKEWEREQK